MAQRTEGALRIRGNRENIIHFLQSEPVPVYDMLFMF